MKNAVKTIFFFFILFFAIVSSASEADISSLAQNFPENFDVQGHRGARGLKPENTLPSFEKALDLGVSTLELDLHYTADGVVVVWHDERITAEKCRLKNQPEIASPDPENLDTSVDTLAISRLTYVQLQSYTCDKNPDKARFPRQNSEGTLLAGNYFQIISLEMLVEFVSEYSKSQLKNLVQRNSASVVRFNIETKRNPDNKTAIGDDFDGVNPGAFELEILRIIAQKKLENRTTVQSFDHRSLRAIRSVNKSIQLAALTYRREVDIETLALAGINIWSMYFKTLTPVLLREAHALNLRVLPWTVNNAEKMNLLIDMGVDGLITDRPDILFSLGR